MYYVSCADFAEEQSQRKEYTLTLPKQSGQLVPDTTGLLFVWRS